MRSSPFSTKSTSLILTGGVWCYRNGDRRKLCPLGDKPAKQETPVDPGTLVCLVITSACYLASDNCAHRWAVIGVNYKHWMLGFCARERLSERLMTGTGQYRH